MKQNAKDYYLANIPRFFRKTEDVIANTMNIWKEYEGRIGIGIEEVRNATKQYQYRYQIFSELGKEVAQWFSKDIKKSFDKGICFVGEVPLLDFNASVTCSDNKYRGVLILLNKGLVNLLNDVIKVTVSSFNIATHDMSQKTDTTLSHKDCINTLMSLFRSIEPGKRYVRPFAKFLSPSKLHFTLQGEMIFSIEKYIIAHEIAHVSLGHINTAGSNRTILSDSNDYIAVHVHSQENEFQADSTAALVSIMDIVVKHQQKGPKGSDQALSQGEAFTLRSRIWGILGFHNILCLLHKSVFGSDRKSSATHPNSRARLDNIYTLLESVNSRLFGFSLLDSFAPYKDIWDEVYHRLRVQTSD